jgi:hypothetical protein
VRVSFTPCDLRVDKKLAAAALACRPTLTRHVCKQGGIGYFGDKLLGATLPHLVEHIAIDLLVEDDQRLPEQGDCQPRAGTTTWLDHKRGIMRVKVSCTPQTVEPTYAALVRAVALVNSLLEQ